MSSHVSPARSRRWQRLPRRLRIVLATKPLAYWSLTVLVAGTVGYAMYSVVASADATKAGFGTMRAVVVAARDVEPGAALDATNTEVRELPVALVPDGVLTALPDGATANTTLLAGEPVHRRRIGRAGDGPVAAMLPDGTRGLAVPRDESGLPLRPGDRVDVVAAFTAGAGGAARLVAVGVTVAHVGDRSVVVAVPVERLVEAAQALADGAVVLALSASP
jgi:Flp pilus assembly protein CpaB